MKCNGTSKRSGKPCKKDAVVGKSKCHIHGGKSPTGMASPHYKDGKRSRYILANLQSTYEDYLQDPKLLELEEEIAVARTYAQEMMNAGGSLKLWEDLEKLFTKWQNAERRRERMKAQEYKQEFEDLMRSGSRQWRNFEQVLSTFERLRRLIESQNKHLLDNRYIMTQEQFAYEIAKVMDHIFNIITNRRERDAVFESVERTLGAAPDAN